MLARACGVLVFGNELGLGQGIRQVLRFHSPLHFEGYILILPILMNYHPYRIKFKGILLGV